jgi:hypothetical protein
MSGRLTLLADPTPQILARELGIPIFPVTADKVPYKGTHGHLDATTDPRQLAELEIQRPGTMWAMPTGVVTPIGRIGVTDIDRKVLADGTVLWGIDSLDQAGIVYWSLPTPTTFTPRGGYHQWCLCPDGPVPSGPLRIGGELVPAVDVKADGGYVILPPGPGRWWDPILGPDTPLAPLPEWAIMAKSKQPAPMPEPLVASNGDYTAYGEGAIDRIVDDIQSAPLNHQEQAINRGAFAIGQLVAGEEISASYALRLFDWLIPRIKDLDESRPWRPDKLRKKFERSYLAGQRRPRSAPR